MKLDRISLKGYRTIRSLDDGFCPGNIAILVGPNGAGKSNFISFFRLLSWAMASPGELQNHIGILGGASALLSGGPQIIREIEARISMSTDSGLNDYAFRLFHAAGDTLVFADERFRFSRAALGAPNRWIELGAGHKEAKLIEKADEGDSTARTIRKLLQGMGVYQFHNTSPSSRMRNKWNADDGRWLKEDGANLASLLLRLARHKSNHYRKIVETIRQIVPFFADFVLEPEHGKLLLRWREQGGDEIFNAAQAADGMLRAMALVSLLLQPVEELPDVLVLDEPELGLHPFAIAIVSGLIRSLSTKRQIILATQSPLLIDAFSPEDVVIVERDARGSHFRRLSADDLKEWLEDYSLSELWEKNVLGGRPR